MKIFILSTLCLATAIQALSVTPVGPVTPGAPVVPGIKPVIPGAPVTPAVKPFTPAGPAAPEQGPTGPVTPITAAAPDAPAATCNNINDLKSKAGVFFTQFSSFEDFLNDGFDEMEHQNLLDNLKINTDQWKFEIKEVQEVIQGMHTEFAEVRRVIMDGVTEHAGRIMEESKKMVPVTPLSPPVLQTVCSIVDEAQIYVPQIQDNLIECVEEVSNNLENLIHLGPIRERLTNVANLFNETPMPKETHDKIESELTDLVARMKDIVNPKPEAITKASQIGGQYRVCLDAIHAKAQEMLKPFEKRIEATIPQVSVMSVNPGEVPAVPKPVIPSITITPPQESASPRPVTPSGPSAPVPKVKA